MMRRTVFRGLRQGGRASSALERLYGSGAATGGSVFRRGCLHQLAPDPQRRAPGLRAISTIDRAQRLNKVASKPLLSRALSTGSAQTSDEKEKRIAFVQAFRSPRNFFGYLNQSRKGAVEFVSHFWTGCKLLAADVRVAFRILKKISTGKSVSRRERNLLVSTGADLARMLPFSFFVVVPLMEFALPFAIVLFPNMLPSQFQDGLKKEEDAKKQLKVRLEVAKYFQDVVSQRAKTVRDSNAAEEVRKEAEELSEFLDDIRNGNEFDEKRVFQFARFFNDELTLDGAVRPQLVAMCRYLGLRTYGADPILRYRIRSKLTSITNDDILIMWEGGVDSLQDDEVLKACQDRGIRTIGVSKRKLRRQLGDWLEMSQNREVPPTLMILSRAFFYTEVPENALKETLSSLPVDVLTDLKIATDKDLTSAERLEELKRQERLIAAEEAQHGEPKDRKEKAEAVLETEPKPDVAPETVDPIDLEVRMDNLKGAVEEGQKAIDEKIVPEMVPTSSARTVETETDNRRALLGIADVLETLESDDPVASERLDLENLKAELLNLEARITDDGEKGDSQVRRLKATMSKLEREFEKTQNKVGLKMKLLDTDKDGVIHIDEVLQAATLIAGANNEDVIKQVLERLDENNDGVFRKEDIKRLRREIKQELGDSID